MPSKGRWTLNPIKWFGTKSNTPHKREKNNNSVLRASPTATTTTITRSTPSISTIPPTLSAKNKIKVVPSSISNDINKTNRTVTQLRLPAFGTRRDKTSTTFYRENTFRPTHTEPTIRKNSRIEDQLAVDATRWNIQSIPTTTTYEIPQNENFPIQQMDMSLLNMSNLCLINYPRHSPNITEERSLRSRSSSSSSGIFTDEPLRTESKERLSALEVLSVESITDSETSLSHSQTRPVIHHYRRPVSVFETMDNKPQERQTSLIRSDRSHSAEREALKDDRIISPPKSRQSSVVIIKNTEKRFPTTQSSSPTLEKAGFVRITNDTYRLNVDKIDHLSHPRKNSIHSFVPYSNYDDPLRPAKDEECYATLPRTTSTEQLHNNIQNDLRIIVDECIRPMATSIEKSRLIKNHRYKRSHTHVELNIENITDKLLSSIDYSIYTRYQRCN